MASFAGIVFKDSNTEYGVSFPDLPGCFTAGVDMDEALANAMEALAQHVDCLAREGKNIPSPRALEELMSDEEMIEDIKDGAVLIHVPLLSTSAVKRRVELQMEANLLDSIDMYAKAMGITRTAFITEAARDKLMKKAC